MYLRVSLTDRCNLRCVYCLEEGARFAPERCSGEELRGLTLTTFRHVPFNAPLYRKLGFVEIEPAIIGPQLVARWAHQATFMDASTRVAMWLDLDPAR